MSKTRRHTPSFGPKRRKGGNRTTDNQASRNGRWRERDFNDDLD